MVASPNRRTGTAGRPVDHAKREAILKATFQLMAAKGLGLTVDDVATAAGVARQTVYNAFGDKNHLLVAAVAARVDLLVEPLAQASSIDDVRETLLLLGTRYVDMLFQPDSIAMMRVMFAQGISGVRLARQFHRAGPQRAYDLMAAYLRDKTASGELAVNDVDQAVEHFYGLLRGTTDLRLLMGDGGWPNQAERHRRAADAVNLFLTTYRPA